MTHGSLRRAWILTPCALLFSAIASAGRAQTTQPSTQPEFGLSPTTALAEPSTAKTPDEVFEELVRKSKNPVPWFKWGADLRLRDEYLHDVVTLDTKSLNNDEHYQRYRARWWASILPMKDVELFVRLGWEGRSYCLPVNPANPNNPEKPLDRGWMWQRDQVMFDNLYLKLSNVGGLPLTIIGGRQDIMLGDGWWTGEGGPLDGARTFYFDAVRATYEFKDAKTTVDLMWLQLDAQGDAWLPKVYEDPIPPLMLEDDQNGVILYVTNRSLPKTEISPYFVYKHSGHEEFLDKRTGYDADLYMFGTRVAGDITDHWKYRTDIAGQFGWRDATGSNHQRICALGSNNRLSYFVNDQWKQEYFVDLEYLSGDDPGTKGVYEGFDILWGRYPRWTELYGFTYVRESRMFDFTNLWRIGPGWKGKPLKNLELGFHYDFLFAPENPMDGVNPMFADGCFRGQLLVPYAKYTFNDHMFFRAMPEVFLPGDYYAKSNNDTAVFWRFEINLTW